MMSRRESPASVEKMNAIWPLASRKRRCQMNTLTVKIVECFVFEFNLHSIFNS